MLNQREDLMKREEISREVLVTEERIGNTKRQIKEIIRMAQTSLFIS